MNLATATFIRILALRHKSQNKEPADNKKYWQIYSALSEISI